MDHRRLVSRYARPGQMPRRRPKYAQGQYEIANAREVDVRRFYALCQALRERPVRVFRLALQALEALLEDHEAMRFRHLLQRLVCAPEGATWHERFAAADLPPLPKFDPPLGCPDPLGEEDHHEQLVALGSSRRRQLGRATSRQTSMLASYQIVHRRPLASFRRLTFSGSEREDVLRIRALRRVIGGPSTIDVFRAAIQALEGRLDARTADVFLDVLRELVCSPVGGLAGLSVASLPPLPPFDPPLGCLSDENPRDTYVARTQARIVGQESAAASPIGLRKVEIDEEYQEDSGLSQRGSHSTPSSGKSRHGTTRSAPHRAQGIVSSPSMSVGRFFAWAFLSVGIVLSKE